MIFNSKPFFQIIFSSSVSLWKLLFSAILKGAAALILEENPGFSPSVVKAALVNTAVSDKIEDAGPDTPNKLLQVKRE